MKHATTTGLALLLLTTACGACGDTAATGDVVGDTVETDGTGDSAAPTDTTASDTVIEPFVYATGCSFPAATPMATGFEMVRAFPSLPAFAAPLMFEQPDDGTGYLYVGERDGVIRRFEKRADVANTDVFLDFSDAVYTDFECGFLGLAFHPNYGTNGKLYTSYCIRSAGKTYSIISRWQRDADNPAVADRASEVELLRVEQPFDNHNGGDIAFGPDGRLYIALGDGGSGNDPRGHGQNTATLLGSILRIDVDTPDPGKPYGIPADNPFANGVNGRPEIFAWGLRNPWRVSFDQVTGQLWVGDVGQGALEEVDIVELGRNYGWKIMEGTICRPGGPDNCDQSGLTLPVAEYGRDKGVSITGGYVYRGAAVPALYGAYIYADYSRRNLFTYKHGVEPAPTEPVGVTPALIAAFGQDLAGEVYLLGISDGLLYSFVESSPAEGGAQPPALLSETGCFSDLAALTPETGVLAYDVALPFWSDGAEKRRWVVLPEGTQATYDPEARWAFPVGTVFLKHFEVASDAGVTRLSMRVLVTGEDGTVSGYTYRWNEAGTDATLLAGADTRAVPRPNDPDYVWEFPSRGQCTTCHTVASGGVLGLESRQIAGQIGYWAGAGILANAPSAPVAPYPAPADAGADLGERARAYLQVNCSGCHQPGGLTGVNLDLRYTTALAEAGLCDAAPARGGLGLSDPRILAPGAPERSVVHERLTRPAFRMPPIGNSRTDPAGSTLIRDWISAGAGCPTAD